ncbi:hypothetical protein [Alteromonas sp. H39]|uniref:polysaccharide deacetylase family protein n=1 Tax=Alteromonas sp. H39 TaxID=3389876 RepID=UPI0039DFBE36
MQFGKDGDISFSLEQGENVGPRKQLESGLPFPKGLLSSPAQLLLTANGKAVDCYCQVLSRWPDNTIRWLLLGTTDSAGLPAQCQLRVSKQPHYFSPLSTSSELITITENADKLTVSTGLNTFELDKTLLTVPSMHAADKKNGVYLRDVSGIPHAAWVKNISVRHFSHPNSGLLKSVLVTVSGEFKSEASAGAGICFEAEYRLYAGLPAVKFDFTVHNPEAARHEGGRWDLGDANSFLFNSLSLEVSTSPQQQLYYRTSPTDDTYVIPDRPFKIQQHASGGKNWQSPAHLDRNNRVPMPENGYSVSAGNTRIKHGMRCQPCLFFADEEAVQGTVSIESFWQNFPSALEVRNDEMLIHLFPPIEGQDYELQGGEKKTHTVWFTDTVDTLDGVEHQYQWRIAADWVAHCNVIPHFSSAPAPDGLQQLIDDGIEGDDSFYAKREHIDEFGWRNFGDLYADHETAFHQSETPFVSHYNNQYDPLFGMLKQYITVGDERWLALARDLARHITDIDIYHTHRDKPEYNGGLFWHTDHYLDAKTSSHRSYSKHHEQGVYNDHAGGGGPGGQHCYTSGLLLHYYITGDLKSKDAVLTLTDWVTRFYEGTGTCLELLMSIRNRHVRGLKDPIKERYPLDRGTANYVNALLDSFELTEDKSYLVQAEHVIQNTFHPNDDIESLDLQNVEYCWFYTVFLQAVARYLFVKEQLDSCDANFYLARDGLCHYAKWMAQNEQPYLTTPDILEYPNDTWTAQDLRKVNVLLLANYYANRQFPEMEEKAKNILAFISEKLTTSKERHYCRIRALLMQNTGVTAYYRMADDATTYNAISSAWKPVSSRSSVLSTAVKRLSSFSLAKEKAWLKPRLNRTAKTNERSEHKRSKPPLLFVVSIDTEEEWDWRRGFPDSNFDLTNIQKLPLLQKTFSELGIRPTYFVDYAVADDNRAAQTILPYVLTHECEIGAHLHPWCNPPYFGKTTEKESHVVNLPKAQTEAKLLRLTEKLKQQFGVQPRSFRTGRWGIDSTVLSLLIDYGYDVDSSVYPFWSTEYFNCAGGPLVPYWPDSNDPVAPGNQHDIYEVPVTVGFNNKYFQKSYAIHSVLERPPFNALRLVGIAWRTQLLRKLYLCPELSTAEDMVTLCHRALDNDYPVLHMYMHSSSLIDNDNSLVNQRNAFANVTQSIRAVVNAAQARREVRFCTLSEAADILKSRN